MKKLFTPSWLRVLSGLCTNLSAAALGLVIISPNFVAVTTIDGIASLTYDLIFAILLLLLAVRLDEKIKQ